MRWRKNTAMVSRGTSNDEVKIDWFPLIRFGYKPRWALWIVRYDNPKTKR